jgi:hypothetical protein
MEKIIKYFTRRIRKALVIHIGAGIHAQKISKAYRIIEAEYGHGKSVTQSKCIDAEGNAIPWFTYPAIDYLKQLDFSDKIMLEWGSGNSSKFFAPRVKQLFSIEHSKEWYEQVKNFALPKHELYYASENQYVEIVDSFQKTFDIIVIDGIRRNDCVHKSPSLLNKGGLIILDNSERYPELCEHLRNQDFIQVDMHGLAPINEFTATTTLFFERSFNIKPLTRQPLVPIGGGY